MRQQSRLSLCFGSSQICDWPEQCLWSRPNCKPCDWCAEQSAVSAVCRDWGCSSSTMADLHQPDPEGAPKVSIWLLDEFSVASSTAACQRDLETPWLLWTKACEGLMVIWPTLPRHPRDVERMLIAAPIRDWMWTGMGCSGGGLSGKQAAAKGCGEK